MFQQLLVIISQCAATEMDHVLRSLSRGGAKVHNLSYRPKITLKFLNCINLNTS